MKSQIKKLINERNISILFIICCGIVCFYLSTTYPNDAGPDERMKMDICRYIAENGKLPHGGDEAVRDPMWGISYGFTPILAYMLGGLFVKITSIFTTDLHTLYISARLSSVFFYCGFIFFTMKIGKEVFKNKFYKWLFIGLVTLLPQMIYIGSYINNDSFAMMCISIIIYYWIKGIKDNWNIKTCVKLAIGLGLCALSYYNAYGYILTSAILFIISGVLNKTKFKDIIKKGLIVFLVAFIVCGWWFIRSAIIYNGDFLGLRTTDEYSNKYAVEEYKASNRLTPQKEGLTVGQMLVDKYWIKITIKSFIGIFGYLNILADRNVYMFAYAIIAIGLVGFILKFFDFKNIKKALEDKQKILLETILSVNAIITIGLSIYYSYTSDFQPQGRYIMPVLIPLMYFVTLGYEILFENIIKKIVKNDIVVIILKIILCTLIFRVLYRLIFLLIDIY